MSNVEDRAPSQLEKIRSGINLWPGKAIKQLLVCRWISWTGGTHKSRLKIAKTKSNSRNSLLSRDLEFAGSESQL